MAIGPRSTVNGAKEAGWAAVSFSILFALVFGLLVVSEPERLTVTSESKPSLIVLHRADVLQPGMVH